jgi:lycopene cyclase domain-containing protein
VSYTALAVVGVVLALGLDLVVLRTRLVRRRAFWVAYAIIIAFQLIVNGVLTYRGIVRYDKHAILGWRIAGAPIEDLLFGFSLVLLTLSWWVWWGRRLQGWSGGPAPRATGPVRQSPADGEASPRLGGPAPDSRRVQWHREFRRTR